MSSTKVFILFFCKLVLSIDLTSAQFSETSTTALVLPAQCFGYTTINDRTRNVNANGNTECDIAFMSGSTWIRFIGESGTHLTTSPTNSNQCGTQVTGWYSGRMPSISETITNGTVCFAWLNDACKWSNTIAVTNCGSFYIYQLTMPPVCAARYCTDTPSVLTTTITTPTTTSAPIILSPQCYNHTTIDDYTRNVNHSSASTCDQQAFSSAPRWIRFVGAGGTQIPTNAVAPNRCGSQATGWYSGQMPTDLDTTTNGTVCFSWESNTCRWTKNILVTNCGSYYVYQLGTPPACSLRYCTDTPSTSTATPMTTATPTTTPTTEVVTLTTPLSFDQCYEYTTINDSSRNVNAAGNGKQCDNQIFSANPQWFRFVGEGGTQIPTSATQPRQCNTDAGGWYSGDMPDIPYTSANGKICFSWTANTCKWNTATQVTNCGSFYVYRLTKPTSCSLRYCTTHVSSRSTANKSMVSLTTIASYFQSLFKKLTRR